ncbi:hypothetical protein JOD55_001121 [Arcanobacterium pluranimalium]|uniref:hypothetical protein n=1 Tax=Arcanobacterium pluranimalium TaxID=108028 RepID=UPI00195993FC|nr:hypothetical protein [Arcanobacterium pluranimalium]MBM7825294.1 hypothetical protein [Arcanobacterium pluranimalium]
MSSRKRIVVLTPFDKPEVVAAILAIHKVDVHVLQTHSGVIVVRDVPVPTFDDWDIAELLGGDPEFGGDVTSQSAAGTHPQDATQDPNEPTAIAAHLSRMAPGYGVVLISAELGDDVGGEPGVSGLVTARRVIDQKLGDEIAPGLLLNSLDPIIEQIILGAAPVAELKGALHTSELPPELQNQFFGNDRTGDDD